MNAPRPMRCGPVTDAELLGHIRQVLEDSPFHGEGYRKVWALRFAGIRTSKERVRRLMRDGASAPHRVGKRGPKAHNGTIRTEARRMARTWDGDQPRCSWRWITARWTAWGSMRPRAATAEALEPIRQGVAERFAGLEADVAEGLKVRHDHGPAYLSDDFQREIAYLGMTSSPSFVRAPEGNGYWSGSSAS